MSHDPRIDALFAEWDRPDSPGCAVDGLALSLDRVRRLCFDRQPVATG